MSENNVANPESGTEEGRFYPDTGLSEKNASIPTWLKLLYLGIAVWFVYYMSKFFW